MAKFRPHHPAVAARRGFSLVELLIVIGIILVLAGIGVVGINMYQDRVATDSTKTSLANGVALVKELEAKGAMNRLVGPSGLTPPAAYQPTSTLNATTFGKVVSGQGGRTKVIVDEYKNKGVGPALLAANGERMKALPKGVVIENTGIDVPVLGDGWGNPLLFVPPGGLTNVKIHADTSPETVTVTSTGQASSPQNRPFWASAGPDGDFTTGDDNVYSFQN